MNREGFCALLLKLNISNVFMVGDSMMHEQWMSFVGIMGIKDDIAYEEAALCPGNYKFRLFLDRSMLASIPPPSDSRTVHIDKWGNDAIKVIPGYGQVAISLCPAKPGSQRMGENMRQYEYVTNNGTCPWMHEYSSLEGRTLLVC